MKAFTRTERDDLVDQIGRSEMSEAGAKGQGVGIAVTFCLGLFVLLAVISWLIGG